MLLGREVDDPARPHELASFGDEHTPDLYLIRFAGFGISSHVVGEAILEHQCDTLAHHAYGIDCVHQRINVRRSEEHTSELQSRENLVCRLLLEKKNKSPSTKAQTR